MRYLQGKFLIGYVTIYVRGNHPELFFQILAQSGIYAWDVSKQSENFCQGNIRSFDMKFIQKIANDTNYEVTLGSKHGLPFMVDKLWRQKEIIVACLLSLILLVGLSQIVWTIDVTGVSKEMEAKISDVLDDQGIKRGTFKFTLDHSSHIQENILHELPELLWIGVEKKGTRLMFTGIEKITQDDTNEKNIPQHLVAEKNGVIDQMRITKGVPIVEVNDYVKAGDKLVSGNLSDALPEQTEDEKEDDEDSNREDQLIVATGEVIAKTWYEVQVTIPLEVNYDIITSEQFNKYYLSFGDKQLLIWGFKRPKFVHTHKESDETLLIKLTQALPVKWIKQTVHEKHEQSYIRTIKEAKEAGMIQAKNSLKRQLGQNANVLSQKVLHEATESGKVKLNLLMTVKENIAKEIPITQGD